MTGKSETAGERLDAAALAHARTLMKLVCRELAPDLEGDILESGAVEALSRAIVAARRSLPPHRRPRAAAARTPRWLAWDADLEALAYVTLASATAAAAARLGFDPALDEPPDAAQDNRVVFRLVYLSELAERRAQEVRLAAAQVRAECRPRGFAASEAFWADLIDPEAGHGASGPAAILDEPTETAGPGMRH